ncbi:hypothetical protein KDW_62010 [Dictyobacter vulcani]|uniref:Glycosyl transferase n=1 Tax=Dictyobacter vulcani TaxID=2607529 RepID=A0A5J4L173_9CHLR|nr:glycosyltransferase [Dictyobacter vulcani]GER92039.1 hypothetical protein KDW_62010 [Dictyobacter vulcani]
MDGIQEPSWVDKKLSTFEMLATHPIQAIKEITRLDKFQTVPMATLRGVPTSQSANSLKLRLSGLFFAATAVYYLVWLQGILNKAALWLSIPYFIATVYMTLLILITIFNNWQRTIPILRKHPLRDEPQVAIMIPTYGEPIEMVQTTMESVLSQEWPQDKMLLIIGDDSHRPEMKKMIQTMKQHFPLPKLIYFEPPRKGNPARKGSAKDGNLNAMLDYVSTEFPEIEFIETRDADDVVGTPHFLRYVMGHFQQHPEVSYIQTIKDTLVSTGDPFGNRQTFFYRGVMFARNATNSVFPCGSGLLWRKEQLHKIGGFPTWNLVEDLYSGYVAMRNGLKGTYLPIVGAVGQVSPEDIPNVYKQLGTWALDTLRIFFWQNPWVTRGLSFRQRMQFTELGFFYLLSLPLLLFIITPIIDLVTGIHPFISDNLAYVMHFWPYALATEILLAFIGDSTTFEEIWRARQIWFGMIFVFIKAGWLALWYGPNKKPAYKVTRKTQQAGLYFRETATQIGLFVLLLAAIIFNLVTHPDIKGADLGSIFWAIFYMFLLTGIISKSWFGVSFKRKALKD